MAPPSPTGTPSPLAGYSPAIRRGDWVFLAGEIPVDWVGDWGRPEYYGNPSGVALAARTNPNFWYDSDVERQTDYVLQKQAAIAEAAGTSLDKAVKATVYLGHPSEFEAMDKVWRHWFPENPPARVVIPYMGLGGRGSRGRGGVQAARGRLQPRHRDHRGARTSRPGSVTSLRRSRPGSSCSSRP